MNAVDQRALRDAFGAFMTGVTVVTTSDATGTPRGFTANSFTSVSLDPPLLLVCIARASRSLETFTCSEGFAVNVLADDQRDVSTIFSRPGEDRSAGLGWRPSGSGAPILDGVVAWFDCSRHKVVDAGDHVILIGRDYAASDRGALGHARGGYFTQTLADHAIAAATAPKVLVGAIVHGPRGVLLVRDGDGWTIPRAELSGRGGSVPALGQLVGNLGLIASLRFIFAVYEENGVQHIVYRCEVEDRTPLKGRFHDLRMLAPDGVRDPAVRSMLARYADEAEGGEFGIYFGDASRGEAVGWPGRTRNESSRSSSTWSG